MKVPEIGQCVVIRNRPAIVRNKFESLGDREGSKIHLIDIDYLDGYNHPHEDRIIWEREISVQLFSIFEFPEISPVAPKPDKPSRFHSFLDALSWSSQGIYSQENGSITYTPATVMSPWFSAVQVEDYQLYPVLQALEMPRVNLLLADDVGLGKTIEAGLILQELIRQRKIRRIMIVCPSSLQIQWQDEMKEKFNIDFTILDSDQIYEMQRSLGMNANPWKVYPRIIISMDYLKQPDILEKYKNTSEQLAPAGSAMLPWDLLIVDEVHNFAPSKFSDDSERSKMLQDIAPLFEHRLFLSATPHNGYTLSFSGILEVLDPVRFQQKSTLDKDDFRHLDLVMIRRMKADLNIGRLPSRFPSRQVDGIPLVLPPEEARLFSAMRRYRIEGTRKMARISKKEMILAQFIFSLLTKRLLSSSYSFARTWWTHLAGFDLTEFGYSEAEESRKRAESAVVSDEEKELREADALRMGGSWLRQYRNELLPFLEEISTELKRLGWTKEIVNQDLKGLDKFPPDSKFSTLHGWIKENLMDKGLFRSDERLIIFTEYKDTLDYLLARFQSVGIGEPILQTLFGGASSGHRRAVKEEFNDSSSQLRILLATDAASEGLNLQNSCRYVIHQEIPWNPMRLEQRNGRVDRHGQSRDVFVWHFVSDQVEDLKFLDFVVKKVETVRGDLGSVGKVLDEAVTEYFAKGNIGNTDIDLRVVKAKEFGDDFHDLGSGMHGSEAEYQKAFVSFSETRSRFGFEEGRIVRLLSEAAILENGSVSCIGDGLYRFDTVPPAWKRLVDHTLLLDRGSVAGAKPKMVFSPERVQEVINGRVMFLPRKDTRLLMLGHPVMQKALSTFTRRLWLPPGEAKLSKWTVETAALPEPFTAIFTLYFQIALRNKLGERFSTGILALPISAGNLTALLSPSEWNTCTTLEWKELPADATWQSRIATLTALWQTLKIFAENERKRIITQLQATEAAKLTHILKDQIKGQRTLFEERRKSLELQKDRKSADALRKELLKAEEKAMQLTFSEELNAEHRRRVQDLRERLSEEDWQRQHSHIELLKQRLDEEERRIIERVLPNRYSLDEDGVEVLPVAVHVLLNQRGELQ